jgi:hypothetical protein
MEIRVLRGFEVRQLLPMADCVDLMRRTMMAVSERRVVLPLRSIMVLQGDRRMLHDSRRV